MDDRRLSTQLLFTYGVVERIWGVISSPVFTEIKSHPTSLKESDLQEIEKNLSELHAASFPNIYQSIRVISGKSYFDDRQYFNGLKCKIRRLRTVAYDIEDVLDVVATEYKVNSASHPQDSIIELLTLPCKPSDLRSRLLDVHKLVEDIYEDLLDVSDSKMCNLGIPEDVIPPRFLLYKTKGIASSSNYNQLCPLEHTFFGRESEKEQLLNLILRPSNPIDLNIISVVGPPGIGKTTLAKLACKDLAVATGFDLVLWALAGYDVRSTIIEIIRSATPHRWFHPQNMDVESLKKKLCDILQHRKFLVVLDDLKWRSSQETKWEELRQILDEGSTCTGRTVIVTCSWHWQSPDRAMNGIITLIGLPENETLSLFNRNVGSCEEAKQQYPRTENIVGNPIFTKECLRENEDKTTASYRHTWNPLAIKTLGRTLRNNKDKQAWKQVNATLCFGLESAPSSVSVASVALRISLQRLPYDLMQCFISSAILLEDKVMSRDQLVYFWLAQGLLQSHEGKEDIRYIGYTYCNELLARGFLHLHHNESPLHELFQIHTEACYLAKSLMDGDRELTMCDGLPIIRIGRHLLWNDDQISSDEEFSWDCLRILKARTFLFKCYVGFVTKPFLEGLISSLRLARVLLLDNSLFEELPDTIGDLKLLRYLSLANNNRLQVLPESICNLVNLQTLDLSGCEQLEALPRFMHKLVSLRHLLLTLKLTAIPEEALKSWTSLHLLKICHCQNLNLLSDGIEHLLALQVLQIHDCPSLTSLPNSVMYLTNLKELSIVDCQTLDLTGWNGFQGLTGLQFLQFHGLPELRQFPEGLQSASYSLRHLVVSDCENLIALPNSLEKCTNLLEITMKNCTNLVSVPREIEQVKNLLKIFDCPKLPPIFPYQKGEVPRIEHPGEYFHAATGEHRVSSTPYGIDNSLKDGADTNHIIKSRQSLSWLWWHPRWPWQLWWHPQWPGKLWWIWHPPLMLSQSSLKLLVSEHRRTKEDGDVVSHNPETHKQQPITQTRAATNSASEFTTSTMRENSGTPDEETLGIQEVDVEKETQDPTTGASSQKDLSKELPDQDVLPNDNILKDCCSIFSLLPEDYEFEEDTLIQLWLAMGYIHDEPEGNKWFNILLRRESLLFCGTNFVTKKKRYRKNVRETENVSDGQNDNSSFYLKWENQCQENINFNKVQHVSLVRNAIDDAVFRTLQQFNELRTLLFLANYGNRVRDIPDYVFRSFKKLRALDLSRTHIKKLPSSVGHMIELRYLDLSWTRIEWLPDVICSLSKLQTLKLRGCAYLHVLPEQIKWLTKLRHLDVDVLRQLETMPKGIGDLVNLRTLSAFLVSTEDGCKIQELKDLNSLTGDFCIAMLEHVDSADEAKEAALDQKNQLKKLELRWTPSQPSKTDEKCDEILKCLQPCSSLEELQILCYQGLAFPDWISGLDQLVSITFYNCEHVSELPPIEDLPFLKHLELAMMNGVEKIEHQGKMGQVAFSSLEKLEVNEMQSLKVWTWVKKSEGDFKSLLELSVKNCPKLTEFNVLPSLTSIKSLEISECQELESLSGSTIPNSLKRLIVEDCPKIKKKYAARGEDWKKIQHIRNKRIWVEDEDDNVDDADDEEEEEED